MSLKSRQHWAGKSDDFSLRCTMDHPGADSVLDKEEQKELFQALPDLSNMDVLELGCGYGRQSTEFLKKDLKSLTAVDFVEEFCDYNRQSNKKHSNFSVIHSCVNNLKIPASSFDLVYSNWLFQYLSDDEARALLSNCLDMLKLGGYLFFRESCFGPPDKSEVPNNRTIYREPSLYYDLFNSVTAPSGDSKFHYGFDLIHSRSLQTYVKRYGNRYQICWLLRKTKREGSHGYRSFQEFLDKQQYSRTGILRYEKIFGRHFVSTGGKDTTEEFLKLINIRAGDHVLDVGCGIGGSAFIMAEKYGARVTGIDLSYNMINIAMSRAEEVCADKVQFEVADATQLRFPESTFDLIYSRDTILHIKDKLQLFSSLLRLLKPVGQLLVSDYCCKEGEWSSQYAEYVAQRGYHLLSPPQYGQVLEKAGFENVKAIDKSEDFLSILERERSRAESMKEEFVTMFSQKDYDAIVGGWADKIVRVKEGDQKWGLFLANKNIRVKS